MTIYKKTYSEKDYADMADIAEKSGQMLYLHRYSVTHEIPEADDMEQEQPSEQTLYYEGLLIAPIDYYVCSEGNITDGTKNENFEDDLKARKQAVINNLKLTGADVERAIVKDKKMTFKDLIVYVEDNVLDVDVKELEAELNANNFFRSHPLINKLGAILGYSSDDIDYLFLNKQFPVKQ